MDNYSYTDSGDSDNLQPPESNYKVKFLCSYGGKIQPRHHDNQLSYVGGETKILALHRSVKFATLVAKLTALCDRDVCFKYQLPGEDLDALISVTNDDDLEHMMHEYDRLPSPAKLRLFLLPVSCQTPALTPVHSFGSTEPNSNVELMFGLEKGVVQVQQEQEPETDDRAVEATNRIQKHIQDLHKLTISAEELQPDLYRKPSDDNLGNYYVPNVTAPTSGYVGLTAPAPGPAPVTDQQPVYMIQTQTPAPSMYHARTVTDPVNHGGYYVQRMPAGVDQPVPVYNVVPQVQSSQQQQFVAQTAYTEMEVAGGGRQVYYTAHGAVVAQPLQQQYQPMALALNQENGGKVVTANLKEFM